MINTQTRFKNPARDKAVKEDKCIENNVKKTNSLVHVSHWVAKAMEKIKS